ncbi:MAG TPA: winged helix-turn-helix transcriptional regulator [Gemmatimonadaceae bacterium]|nr:winged helix-turn-helix transcriptional regulator [Gemmatimonadaceae bacterium]
MATPDSSPHPSVGLHKGPRAAILIELKRALRLTAQELATRLSSSLNAIRHHLKELEAESLIEYDRERRGVGAPVFAYRLSAAGEALFPRRYEETLLEVLDQVVERGGREAAVTALEGQFESLRRKLAPAISSAPPEQRAELVARALVNEGYMAEWEGSGTEGALREHNCAVHAVAQRFPELCEAEVKFLEEMLGASVERQSHILNGCAACEYTVKFKR